MDSHRCYLSLQTRPLDQCLEEGNRAILIDLNLHVGILAPSVYNLEHSVLHLHSEFLFAVLVVALDKLKRSLTIIRFLDLVRYLVDGPP